MATLNRKLVLYSDQVIPENREIDQRMLRLFSKHSPTIGYIPSSADPDRHWYEEKCRHYADADLGANLQPYFELDLNYDIMLLERLFACDGIHFSGGNTFYFLHWLRERDLLAPLKEYAYNGGVLIGVSAGAILMTPDISSARLCGDEPGRYGGDTSSLGLVDFLFLPHYHPTQREALSAFQKGTRRTLYACPDGGGIVVDGEDMELYGGVFRVE